MAAQPVPEGYHTLIPYLAVDDAAAAIEFYKRAFGATERMRMDADGKIAHAELEIGDSVFMLADQFPMSSTRPPKELGGTTAGIFVYTEDIDALFAQAIDAGATSVMDPENMFWGDRFGTLTDPFGHVWNLSTHVEDVPPEEMAERSRKWQEQMAATSA
jgi:PhnB protein